VPGLPEGHRGVEQGARLGDADQARGPGRAEVEHQPAELAGTQRDLTTHITLRVHPPARRLGVVRLAHEVDRHRAAATALEDRALIGDVRGVRLAAVVEPRRDLDIERDLPAHAPQHPDEPVTRFRCDAGERHEVDHFTHAGLGHEPGDQNCGVREVELTHLERVVTGPDAAVTPLVGVEQRPEDAGRVEPRRAEPVDGAVHGDQRSGL
jgi:hypothetical protein